MSAAVSPLDPHAIPSDLEAAGVLNIARKRTLLFDVEGNLTAITIGKRYYVEVPARIVKISSFRRTAGAGAGAAGSTDVDVNLNGATILSATMQHENADGDDNRLVGTLLTTHAAYTAHGITLAPGDYLDVDIDAIEAGATAPTDLTVQIEIQVG